MKKENLKNMRKGNDSDFIYSENQEVIGINLGADFCAEHEWGIDGIKRGFGISINDGEKPFSVWWKSLLGLGKPVMGVEKRAITKCSDTLIKGEGTVELTDYSSKKRTKQKLKVYYLGYKDYYYFEDRDKVYKEKLKEIWDGSKQVWGWWSENDFMVATTNQEVIEQLFQAFQNKDIVIMLGGGHVFKNSGLCLIQKSKISEENKQVLFENDLDSWELKKAAVSTGIYERLEKANKKFYALSPRWKDKEKKEVIFWLNPQDQQNNNSGWFTIEELDMWTKDKGPVIEKEKKTA